MTVPQYYLTKSLGLFKYAGSITHIFDNQKELGLLYRAQGRYEQAELSFLEGLETAQAVGSAGRAADVCLEIGKLYLETKEIGKARENFVKSQQIFEETRDLEGLQEVHVLLSDLAHEEGNMEAALGYLELAANYKDTFYTSNSNRRLAELRTRFENRTDRYRIRKFTPARNISDERTQCPLLWCHYPDNLACCPLLCHHAAHSGLPQPLNRKT